MPRLVRHLSAKRPTTTSRKSSTSSRRGISASIHCPNAPVPRKTQFGWLVPPLLLRIADSRSCREGAIQIRRCQSTIAESTAAFPGHNYHARPVYVYVARHRVLATDQTVSKRGALTGRDRCGGRSLCSGGAVHVAALAPGSRTPGACRASLHAVEQH